MTILKYFGPVAIGLMCATSVQAATQTYTLGDKDCHSFGAATCADGDTFANPGTPQVGTDSADIGNDTDNFDRHSHSQSNATDAGLFFDFNVDLNGEVATSAKIEFNTYSLDFAFVGSATLSGSNPEDGAVFFFNGIQHSIHKGLGDATTFRDFSLDLNVADIMDSATNTFRIHGDGLTTINDDFSVDFVTLTIETQAATPPPTGVPIPAGGLLLASALGLLGWQRRRG